MKTSEGGIGRREYAVAAVRIGSRVHILQFGGLASYDHILAATAVISEFPHESVIYTYLR